MIEETDGKSIFPSFGNMKVFVSAAYPRYHYGLFHGCSSGGDKRADVWSKFFNDVSGRYGGLGEYGDDAWKKSYCSKLENGESDSESEGTVSDDDSNVGEEVDDYKR